MFFSLFAVILKSLLARLCFIANFKDSLPNSLGLLNHLSKVIIKIKTEAREEEDLNEKFQNNHCI